MKVVISSSDEPVFSMYWPVCFLQYSSCSKLCVPFLPPFFPHFIVFSLIHVVERVLLVDLLIFLEGVVKMMMKLCGGFLVRVLISN